MIRYLIRFIIIMITIIRCNVINYKQNVTVEDTRIQKHVDVSNNVSLMFIV